MADRGSDLGGSFAMVNAVFGSWVGRLVLFGYSWALMHHMLGGIRHLVWDTGSGLGREASTRIAWATLAGSVALTVLIWIAAFAARGWPWQLQTPLGKVRGLGSAREGTGHFWRQRLTAVANVPLILFFVGLLVSLNGAAYSEVRAALANPLVTLVLLLALLSVLYHMRLGMQVIIEDYVHGDLLKVALVMLNIFFALAVGVAAAFALLKLAFGG